MSPEDPADFAQPQAEETAGRPDLPTNPAVDPGAVFERFSRRLIGLAQGHLNARLQYKVEPEDVVQSAYKSFFLRYGDGALAAEGWDGLWGLLTTTTVSVVAAGPLTAGVTYELWLVGHNSQGDGPESNHVTHVAT